MNIIVVGGGAAGMMAAAVAAEGGDNVTLIEKNEKLGKKVYITGKGRCNLTNACDDSDFFENVVTNSKFMYSAYYGFTAFQVMDYFEALGLKLKVERGNRVFPVSDHSSDVIGSLKRELNRQNVKILYNTKVVKILVTDVDKDVSQSDALVDRVSDKAERGVASGKVEDFGAKKCVGVRISENGKESDIYADKVILATGGMSYKACGADGDTWKFADDLGIDTKTAEPSLVPFETKESFVKDMQGLSLKNVSVSLLKNGKKLYDGFGEMLFTHFGVSGPLILTASTKIKESVYGDDLKLYIDLKPAMSEKELDDRVVRDFAKYSNKQFINALSDLLPAKMIPTIVDLCGIDPRKQVNIVTKEERRALVGIIKKLELTITSNRGFDEAIITRGGISVKEINPGTMESKKYKGLFFAGEMIDVDAVTGGFNLQIAWSTGHLAAQN